MIDKSTFKKYSQFGDTQSDGTTITLKNIDKWIKDAKVFTKSFTTTDTGICFSRFKVKKMPFEKFNHFIKDLCSSKKMILDEFITKLNACQPASQPGISSTTKVQDMDVTQRLTDTKKYTGTHKARFDKYGMGKGLDGRKDLHVHDGYVQAYKGKDTYDKQH